MLRLLTFSLLALSSGIAYATDRQPLQSDLPRVLGSRDPSEPREHVPRSSYVPVTAATKSYRPVEPLPWGDLNRRVAPPARKN